MWKQFVADYLTFTKKERTGLLVLVVIILVVALLPFIWPKPQLKKPDEQAFRELQRQLAQLKPVDSMYVKEKDDENSLENYYTKSIKKETEKGVLFHFDPNTITESDWKRLGLRDKTIRTIQHFVSKGGRFKKPEDLKKIYGLFDDEYERLFPYINIKNEIPGEGKKIADSNRSFSGEVKKDFHHTAKEVKPIDINLADTTAFIALPGIGSKLANRIINFREKLGGFYTVDQVAETYGVPDSTFRKIKPLLQCNNPSPGKLDINTDDVNTLKQHPYIRWALANAIIQYRKQHGDFKSVEELMSIALVTQELLQKLKPYLKIKGK